MGEIGSGNGSSYPSALDIDASPEIDHVTYARADVPNDLASAIIAIETELGTNPSGTATDLKTFLQAEHDTDGTHGTIDIVTVGTNVVFNEAGWPSCSVYRSTALSTSGTLALPVKVIFDDAGEEFDGANAWNGTTGVWFPLIAGKYLITAQATITNLPAGKQVRISVFMDNVVQKTALRYNDSAATTHDVSVAVTGIFQANGTSNGFDIRVGHDNGGSLDFNVDSDKTFVACSRVG